MEIKVLTFEGCPSCNATLGLVQDVVDDLGLEVEVNHVQVPDESAAARLGFFGSPSV